MRRYIDAALTLYEAGVKTADVDRKAREAITEALPDVVKAIMVKAADDIGAYAKPEDDFGDYNSNYYDRLYHWIEEHKEEVFATITKTISKTLTNVTASIAKERFGKAKADRHYYQVELVARELSDDPDKHFGGYHSGHRQLLRVFLNGNQIIQGMYGVLHVEFFGEDSEGYRDRFINEIVPIFTHEYVHYEQAVRGRSSDTGDFGFITIGQKRQKIGGKRRGKRGGFMRSTKSDEDYFRYMGSTHEIDAYASSAAAELTQEIRQDYNNDHARQNERIRDVLDALRDGYIDSPDYRRYFSKYYESLEQQWPGLRHDEMTKVWHRFSRMLYSKLRDYLHPTVGKVTAEYAGHHLNAAFVRLAQKATMPQMVQWLAERTARAATEDAPWKDAEMLTTDITRGYAPMQVAAEQFIRDYYFGRDWWDKETQLEKVVTTFRNMAARYAAQIKSRNTEAGLEVV